ncbi:hypothetical protein RQP53_16160 [Paucibacter sp. APW11]|uniref:Uncharacterized protein n=1 Tax=Roseateles aquae TaxID=3077235 RepID=A0ABU3PDY7_9BURK|nr:hypothetical protein [Paucibacter sp. APW11]MDT9000812.1 hypothetical protein [Paucibacter sp. APW11]
MKKEAFLICVLLGLSTLAAAQNHEAAHTAGPDQRTLDQIELQRQLAPIKSAQDLTEYLNRKLPDSPLNKLSPAARKRFIESLRFNEKGLTTFQYTDLESELSVSEIYQVLSLFGVQHYAAGIRGARISSPTDRLISNANFCAPYLAPALSQATPARGLCDHDNYQCIGRATCESSGGRICTSNC